MGILQIWYMQCVPFLLKGIFLNWFTEGHLKYTFNSWKPQGMQITVNNKGCFDSRLCWTKTRKNYRVLQKYTFSLLLIRLFELFSEKWGSIRSLICSLFLVEFYCSSSRLFLPLTLVEPCQLPVILEDIKDIYLTTALTSLVSLRFETLGRNVNISCSDT